MKMRRKISRKASRKLFVKTAMRHRKKNSAAPLRGGLRL